MPGDYDKVAAWARRLTQVAREPISEPVKGNIASRLHRSALNRARAGRGPDGEVFPALSKRYAARKRRAGVAQTFWIGPGSRGKGGGQAIKRIDEFIRGDAIEQIINVPYSGAVHNGAVFTVKAPASSSIESRRRFEKSVARRRRATNKRLKQIYGQRTAAQNRRAHAASLREAAIARKQGRAELLPQYRASQQRRQRISEGLRGYHAVKRGLASKFRRTSWVVRIPARPILGVDQEDRQYIAVQLLRDVGRRLKGAGSG